MYTEDKVKQLQNKSHVRGVLSKEFYYAQESEKEKKRRQMKRILDQQVEERKRKKQLQEQQYRRKLRKEEEDINKYYVNLAARDKKQYVPPNQYNNRKQNHLPENQHNIGSRSRKQNSSQNNHKYTSIGYQEDIPVMGKIDNESQKNQTPLIPVLDLGDQPHKRKKTKANKQSKRLTLQKKEKQKERLQTLQSQKNVEAGVVNNPPKESEIQQQNKKLKQQLKKSEEVITLMLNVLKSYPKFDKYRIEAQRILNLNNNIPQEAKDNENNKESTRRFFPSLTFTKKSLIHQYLMQDAKKLKKLQKTKRVTG